MTPSKPDGTTTASRPRLTSRAATVLACAALLSLLAITIAVSAWLLRQHALEDWRQRLDDLTQILAEEVARDINASDLLLDSLNGIAHASTPAELASAQVYRTMRDQISMLPQISQATIVNAEGAVVNDSGVHPAAPLRLGDREYFSYHRDHAAGRPYVSAPARSRNDGRWVFYVSRRLDDAHGRFAGVVLVEMPCDFFADLLRSASPGGQATLSLYRGDFTLLARWPRQAGDTSPRRQEEAPQTALTGGKLHTVTLSGAGHHMTAMRAVRDYPLAITATVEQTALLAGWWPGLRLLGSVATVSALGMLAVFGLLTRRLRQRERDAGQALTRQAQAERDSQAKSRLLALMSDATRAPMNAVLDKSGLLLETALDPTQRRHAGDVQQGALALCGILNNVLDFSAIESSHMSIARQPLDPVQLAEQALAAHQLSAAHKGLSIRRQFAVPPGMIEGDPLRLRQVLDNLLSNAIKFTTAGDIELGLSTVPHGDQWLLRYSVRDTGTGVSEQARRRLFEPFSRDEPGGHRTGGGTGLGLAVCQRLVTLMGGRIHCDSAPGAGATFSFEVPTRFISAPAPAAAAPQPQVKRVLLVEDMEMNRQLARILLERLGWAVDEAHDGAQALAALENQPYAMVLMDCMMPVMDGYEATRRFRAWEAAHGRARTPVVALTASAVEGERQRCLAAGADDYLAKPFTAAAFADVLRRWVA